MRLVIFMLLVNALIYAQFDKKTPKDDSGAWKYQHDFAPVLIGSSLSYGVAFGKKTRFDQAVWTSIDALLVSSVITTTLKGTARRKRPRDTESPNDWGDSSGATSFPSGHTASVAALTAPIILEYKDDKPWIWALSLATIYQGAGRVKAQAHWASDVVVGAIIGASSGYFAHEKQYNFLGYILPKDGFINSDNTKAVIFPYQGGGRFNLRINFGY